MLSIATSVTSLLSRAVRKLLKLCKNHDYNYRIVPLHKFQLLRLIFYFNRHNAAMNGTTD